MKILDALFDESMSINDHNNRVINSYFYQLSRIKSICWLLPTSTVIQQVSYFVISRVDYCNSNLMGFASYQLDFIQFVLNVAAKLI